MSENLHNIDDFFRRALNDDEEEPSGKVWENIDRKLDKKSVININRKYYRLKWVAAASLIAAFALGMYTMYTRKINGEIVKESRDRSKTNEGNRGTYKEETAQNKGVVKSEETAPTDNKIKAKDDVSESRQELTADEKNSLKPNNTQNNIEENSNSKSDKATASVAPLDKSPKHTSNTLERLSRNNALQQSLTSDKTNTNVFSSASNKGVAKKSDIRSVKQSSPASVEIVKQQNSLASQIVPEASYVKDVSALLAMRGQNDDLANVVPQATLLNKTLQPLFANDQQVQKQDKLLALKNKRSGKSKSPFSVTAFFSPDAVAGRIVNDKKVFREEDKSEIKRTEKTASSSSVGLLLTYNLYKKWSIQSGFMLSSTVKDIANKPIYARPDSRGDVKYRFNCSSGYSYITLKTGTTPPRSGDSVVAVTATNTLRYIGIPLAIKYRFEKGNFSFSPSIGVVVNLLKKGNIETEIATASGKEKTTVKDIQGLKPTYFGSLFNFEASYKLSNAIALSVAPTARFALSSINKNAPVKSYQNKYGVWGGLTLSF